MTRDPAPRRRILDAVVHLSAIYPLEDVSADILAEAAGLEPGEFQAEFASLPDCLCAAQQQFMDGLRTRVLEAALSCGSGFARLKAGSSAYLDACLENRTLRSWLLQARDRWPAVADGLRRQNETYIVVLAPEFKTLGWPHPAAAARLYMAMLLEASQVEHAQGRALIAARDTLWDFLKTF